jgi:uncharacterized protein YutE (UPF0331/DUF86 family)
MKNKDFDIFSSLVGETICYCQVIENDLTVIYSSLISDKYEEMIEKFDELSDKNFGFLLVKLEDRHFLSKGEAYLLNKMRVIRNYLCHETYLSFIYLRDEEKDEAMKEEYRKIHRYRTSLRKTAKRLEDIKVKEVESFKKRHG